MSEQQRNLKFLARHSMRRPPRKTSSTSGDWPGLAGGAPRLVTADLFIETYGGGERRLVARYETGGDDFPIVDGLREFRTEIPADWSEARVLRLINNPTVAESPY